MVIVMSNGKVAEMRRSEQSGFTLIEVAIAVAILGVALVSLVTIQTHYTSAALHERNLLRAVLFAQYHLAIVDADGDYPDPGTEDKPLIDILDEDGYFGDDTALEAAKSSLQGWQFRQVVSKVGVPPFTDAMRRLDITITWDDGRDYEITYFLKGDLEIEPGA